MTNYIEIFHSSAQPWLFIDKNRTVNITVRIKRGMAKSVYCINSDPSDTYADENGEKLPNSVSDNMELYYSFGAYDYYGLTKRMATHKLRYHFRIETNGCTWVYDETGVSKEKKETLIRPFFINYVFDSTVYDSPLWASETVWYQVFPDRFCKGKTEFSAGSVDDWDYMPVTRKDVRYGGDFAGLINKIDYLKELGITGIYLNPIFTAYSNHKYDTIDYYRIDPDFGTEEDFIELCNVCHRSGIKIMLDGVFNHCSHMAPQFQDVLKNGKRSKYYNWFIIYDENKLPQCSPTDVMEGSFKNEPLYETFAFVPTMPKWNTENPEVIDFLIGAAEYWTKRCHIDAWRLDVPDETSPEFLRTFRRRIKAVDPDIYIIGEIWSRDSRWLQGDMFDGVMNYTLYFLIRDYIGNRTIDAYAFADRMMQFFLNYPESVQSSMFNFCSNHDIPRIFRICSGSIERSLLCYLITSVLPGGLSVYYGDEVPLDGGHDPDNRRCLPWNDTFVWDADYGDSVKRVISFKQNILEEGRRFVYALDTDTVKISIRGSKTSFLYVTRSESRKRIQIESGSLRVSFGNGIIEGQNLMLPPYGYAFIRED